MSDDFNASTESATPADSPSGDGAASVGGGGVTADSATPSTPSQEASAPDATQQAIAAGWSLEDEGEASTAPVIPEDDSDIDGMAQEPGLDPERTPGLVTALRNARQAVREHAQAARQAAEVQAELERFGGIETVRQQAEFVNALFAGQVDEQGNVVDGSSIPFFAQLADYSNERYQQVLADGTSILIEHNPEYLISRLQEAGKLPADLTASASQSGPVDQEVLASLPEHLRDTYRGLAANRRAELDAYTDPEARIAELQDKYDLQQIKSEQQQAREREWQGKVEAAQSEGQKSFEKLATDYESAHYRELSKWQPFGPSSPENQLLHRMVVEGAWSSLIEDGALHPRTKQTYKQMYEDSATAIQQAPLYRLRGEKLKADEMERNARNASALINAGLGQRIQAAVKTFDQVFRDARAYREQQRQQQPQRAEIPGAGSGASAGRPDGAPTVDSSGRFTSDFKRSLVEGLRERLARR